MPTVAVRSSITAFSFSLNVARAMQFPIRMTSRFA
jgi:hypothetical protein